MHERDRQGQKDRRGSSCSGLRVLDCPRSRLCDLGRHLPLPFFFGSFESSVVSSVGFLFGQPVGRGHACSQYRHCLSSVGQALNQLG